MSTALRASPRACVRIALPGLLGEDTRHLLDVLLHRVGDLLQQAPAVARHDAAPCRKRLRGRFDGAFDVFRAAAWDMRDGLAGTRRLDRELPPARGADPGPVDEHFLASDGRRRGGGACRCHVATSRYKGGAIRVLPSARLAKAGGAWNPSRRSAARHPGRAAVHTPLTFFRKNRRHGSGNGPTGTSISVGSLALMASPICLVS